MDTAIAAVVAEDWVPARDANDQDRRGAQVAELAVVLGGWPLGTRAICRREKPHAGAQAEVCRQVGELASARCCARARNALRRAPPPRGGDPVDEVLGAWLAKESVRDNLPGRGSGPAALLADKAIVACADDDVRKIVSLSHTLAWRPTDILAHHDTDASKGLARTGRPMREQGEALPP